MLLRVLLTHPGASWSTADVETGLRYGLKYHGVDVVSYRLDERIQICHKYLYAMWRQKKKGQPDLTKPTTADIMYQAGVGALEMALRHQVDVVLIVSAMLFHPDIILMMKRAGLRVTVLFTESPYDHEKEIRIARDVDGCWTNERSVLDAFRSVNRHAGYLPHAWNPEQHTTQQRLDDADYPSHDVVFVGTGFRERAAFFNAINWTGIDLGLYGSWDGVGLKKTVPVAGDQIINARASALYRRAKIGLNLYRTSKGWGKKAPTIAHAESLNPRAYELAACGAFHLSDCRTEVREVFGDLVPTFQTPLEAAALMRVWLADADGRARVSALLPATVAEASWVHRAKTVIGDLQVLLTQRAA